MKLAHYLIDLELLINLGYAAGRSIAKVQPGLGKIKRHYYFCQIFSEQLEKNMQKTFLMYSMSLI